MSENKRVSLIDMFSIPSDYKPPDDAGLASCTDYPNQNSREYRKKPVNQSPKCFPFFETADINDDGHFVVGTNNYRSRILNGWGWGFERPEDVGDETKGVYKFKTTASITNVQFVDNNMFLMSNALGQIDVWSTKNGARAKGYCLFNIGSRTEHTSIVSSMDIFLGKTTAVSGSKDGTLKVWDMGQADLHSTNTFYDAHSDDVTSVCASSVSESLFVTASRDKSLLMWDYRVPKPATGE